MVTTSLLLVCSQVQAEIYKCTDAEDNLIYQQIPCPTPASETEKVEALLTQDRDNREDTTEHAGKPVEVTATKTPEVVAQCKKQHRDAIDAIDAEMRQSYSPEQGETYRQRLRVLTEQLRAC